jgi:signal transduction histidine kinase
VALAALDLLTGLVLVAVGLAAARHSWRYAVVCTGAALAWFLAPLADALLLVHRPLLLHGALGFPGGRLPGGSARALVTVAWIAALVPSVGRHPGAMLLLGVLTAGAAWSRATRSAWSGRADAATSAAAVTALALALALPAGGRLVLGPDPGAAGLSGLYSGLVLLAGLLLLAGVVLRTHRRATDAVIELSETTTGEVLEALRTEAAGRSAPEDRRALLAAAELLAANARLQEDLARTVEDVRASRERLVEAGVTERRRLGQSLDAGARRHLEELRSTVSALAEGDEEVRRLSAACCAEVDRTQADLDQLAQGLHPRLLAERGLGPALTDLGDRCPVPVQVRVEAPRLPEAVETALWYACAEALTNVVKHAGAATAALSVQVDDGEVVACVCDDGVGGARAVPGGGLAGLVDRLSVVGGRVAVGPGPDGGTQVCIRVPIT